MPILSTYSTTCLRFALVKSIFRDLVKHNLLEAGGGSPGKTGQAAQFRRNWAKLACSSPIFLPFCSSFWTISSIWALRNGPKQAAKQHNLKGFAALGSISLLLSKLQSLSSHSCDQGSRAYLATILIQKSNSY